MRTTTEIYEQAIKEGRSHMKYSTADCDKGWTCEYDLTEAEQRELEEAYKEERRQAEANYKHAEQLKAKKKEELIKKDLTKGITPEMKKARTYAKRYANMIKKNKEEIERLLDEIKEYEEKEKYWTEKTNG